MQNFKNKQKLITSMQEVNRHQRLAMQYFYNIKMQVTSTLLHRWHCITVSCRRLNDNDCTCNHASIYTEHCSTWLQITVAFQKINSSVPSISHAIIWGRCTVLVNLETNNCVSELDGHSPAYFGIEEMHLDIIRLLWQ